MNEAIRFIKCTDCEIELIDCDHDLGDYAKDGGNGIKLLDWLVEQGLYYKIHLHTMNPGVVSSNL